MPAAARPDMPMRPEHLPLRGAPAVATNGARGAPLRVPCWSAIAAIAAASALASPSAGAQVNATSDYLARMDSDANGRVSLVEYQDWMSYAFDGMDRNRDGVLAPDELPGGKGTTIDRREYRARIAGTFNRQDRNRDGTLDARELASPPQ